MRNPRAMRWMVPTALTSLLLVSCDDGVSPGSPREADPAVPAGGQLHTLPQCYFILQGSDLVAPEWPADFVDYGLIVCNPSLTAGQIATVRQAIPEAILLAYFDVQSVPINRYSEPYYVALSAAMDTTLCVTDLASDCMVKLEEWRNPEVVLTQASADLLVTFHRDVTMAQDWDGMYLDQCTRQYPIRKQNMLLALGVPFDIDGDDEADSIDDLKAQYETWRPYFTSELRRRLSRHVSHPDEPSARGGTGERAVSNPKPVLLVGNVARDILDPALSGITFEAIGVAIQLEHALLWAAAQQTVAAPPKLLAVWSKLPQSVIPSIAFAMETGAYYGTLADNDEDIGHPDIH